MTHATPVTPVTPAMPDSHPGPADTRVDRVVQLYESLVPEDLAPGGRLGRVYHPQARFKDPFNEVQGLPALQAIFGHMFQTLQAPRFTVRSRVAQGDEAFLTWDFHFRRRGSGGGGGGGGGAAEWCIHGASHLQFGADGRVQSHRDYWDAAEELYEKLPLIGALMRWLKRRAGG